MLIDWFTVGAQALNFLILVWLLKRFLYQPILNAIDAREKRIAAELADTDEKRKAAEKERDEFQRKNAAFDQQRAALMGKATEDAKAERQRLLDAARQNADDLSAKRQETLRNDARDLSKSLASRTRQQVFDIARKTLADIASASLEERIGAVLTGRLRALDGAAKETFAKALKASAQPLLVRSAFEMPEAQRAMIGNAINETFSADVPLRFETAPALISGIEMGVNGQKLSWNIDEYLAAMERSVDELLKEKDIPEAPAKHAPDKAVPEDKKQ